LFDQDEEEMFEVSEEWRRQLDVIVWQLGYIARQYMNKVISIVFKRAHSLLEALPLGREDHLRIS
jgi:hypothetical protein